MLTTYTDITNDAEGKAAKLLLQSTKELYLKKGGDVLAVEAKTSDEFEKGRAQTIAQLRASKPHKSRRMCGLGTDSERFSFYVLLDDCLYQSPDINISGNVALVYSILVQMLKGWPIPDPSPPKVLRQSPRFTPPKGSKPSLPMVKRLKHVSPPVSPYVSHVRRDKDRKLIKKAPVHKKYVDDEDEE